MAFSVDSEESVPAAIFPWMLPLTTLSTGFVPLVAFPGWIQPLVEANPFSSAAETSRAMVNGGEVQIVAHARQAELAEEIGIQKGAAFDQASAQKLGRQLGVKYFFTGKLTGVDERLAKERRVQYTLFMQVLEIETGLVKFQKQASRSKAVRR